MAYNCSQIQIIHIFPVHCTLLEALQVKVSKNRGRKLSEPYDVNEKLTFFFVFPSRRSCGDGWKTLTLWTFSRVIKNMRELFIGLSTLNLKPNLWFQALNRKKSPGISLLCKILSLEVGQIIVLVTLCQRQSSSKCSQVGLSIVLEMEATQKSPTAPCEIRYYNPTQHTQICVSSKCKKTQREETRDGSGCVWEAACVTVYMQIIKNILLSHSCAAPLLYHILVAVQASAMKGIIENCPCVW